MVEVYTRIQLFRIENQAIIIVRMMHNSSNIIAGSNRVAIAAESKRRWYGYERVWCPEND